MIHTKVERLSNRALTYYGKFEKYVPILSFIGGFTWDSLTLTRIDRLSDNFILLFYLILTGVAIVLFQLGERNRIQLPVFMKYKKWLPIAIQFFMGGLLSSYVVFYVKSAAFSQSWIFISILLILLVANEFLEKRVSNLTLLISMYFFVSLSFFVFFIPVVISKMNTVTFLASGTVSYFYVGGLVFFLHRKSLLYSHANIKKLMVYISLIWAFVLFSYWRNYIPPVPLSLKFGNIYHHVHKGEDGYHLHYVTPAWYRALSNGDKPFYYAPGDTVFCFASVFAPTHLQKKVYHHWEYYNKNKGEWIQTDKMGYQIAGGRDGGYRGYTFKRHVMGGEWRVLLKTEEGLVLGKIPFTIIPVDSLSKPIKKIIY